MSVATTRPPVALVEADWGRRAVENLLCSESSLALGEQAIPEATARIRAHRALIAYILAATSGARRHVVRSRLTGAQDSKLGQEVVRALAEQGEEGVRHMERFVGEHLTGLDERTAAMARATLAWVEDLLAALAGLPDNTIASLTRRLFALLAWLRQAARPGWGIAVLREDRPPPRDFPAFTRYARTHRPPGRRSGPRQARVRSRAVATAGYRF